MDKAFRTQKTFKVFMFLSLGFGIIFFCTNHLDFLIAAIQYGQLSIPNIAYIIERTLTSIIAPLVFILPSIFPYGRIKSAKTIFIASGICHLAELFWIIPFFMQGHGKYLFTAEKVIKYIEDSHYEYFSVTWDFLSFPATIFTVLLGLSLIYVGKNFDKYRTMAPSGLIVALAFKVFLPLFYNIFVRTKLYSMYWVTNNYLELLSVGFFTLAILIVSTGDDSWVRCVWDQEIADNPDDLDTLE